MNSTDFSLPTNSICDFALGEFSEIDPCGSSRVDAGGSPSASAGRLLDRGLPAGRAQTTAPPAPAAARPPPRGGAPLRDRCLFSRAAPASSREHKPGRCRKGGGRVRRAGPPAIRREGSAQQVRVGTLSCRRAGCARGACFSGGVAATLFARAFQPAGCAHARRVLPPARAAGACCRRVCSPLAGRWRCLTRRAPCPPRASRAPGRRRRALAGMEGLRLSCTNLERNPGAARTGAAGAPSVHGAFGSSCGTTPSTSGPSTNASSPCTTPSTDDCSWCG